MKDGFGRNLKSKKGRYYCSSCGNITFHNGKGVCENAFLNKFKKVPMKAKLTRGLESIGICYKG